MKPGMVVNAFNPRTWVTEASLGYMMRPCVKKRKQNKNSKTTKEQV
jgi:hypothetical protein